MHVGQNLLLLHICTGIVEKYIIYISGYTLNIAHEEKIKVEWVIAGTGKCQVSQFCYQVLNKKARGLKAQHSKTSFIPLLPV